MRRDRIADRPNLSFFLDAFKRERRKERMRITDIGAERLSTPRRLLNQRRSLIRIRQSLSLLK